jgi:dsDNA-binding SOS-regulon protein
LKIENPKKRFVIHKHTLDNKIHWDLMIEFADCLKTWRLDNSPEKLATEKTKATPIFDHDKKFLIYQGSVNNGQGTVEIVDEGTCKIIPTDKNKLKINFEGKILKGNFSFEL